MNSKTLALLCLGLAASFASAETLVVNVPFAGDIDSFDDYGATGNQVFLLDMGSIAPGYTNFAMSGVGWDVTITAEGASWLSEATVAFNNSTNDSPDEVWLSPGAGNYTPGTMSFSSGGIIQFSSIPLNNMALNGDNILRLEFFESYDDVPGTRDGFWHQGGTLDLQFEATAVPEPASMAVLSLGAAALLRRRRK